MIVRRALESDSKDLWHWRNDPQTRKNSTNENEISWDDHSVWFSDSLESDAREIYLGLDDQANEPIGMVRFDFDVTQASSEVSINLNPGWREKGISESLLSGAIEAFQHQRSFVLIAQIKPQNSASIKCFENCGFALESDSSELLIFKNKQGIIDAIERVRSTNNVNWMDLMRLAFMKAPKEAGEIVGRINEDDGKIAALLKRLGD